MSFSDEYDSYLLDTGVDSSNWVVKASQNAPDPVQSTLSSPMCWEDNSQSVDLRCFDSPNRSSQTRLGSVLAVVPPAPDQAEEQPFSLYPSFRRTAPAPSTLFWQTNETLLGYNPSDGNEKTDFRIDHTYHALVSSPSGCFNIRRSNDTIPVPMPMAGAKCDTREGPTVHPRAANTRYIISFILIYLFSTLCCLNLTSAPDIRGRYTSGLECKLKCEWEGCTYKGTFGRRGTLNRHVETQHLCPKSYECPEPRCGKLFNRKDNLLEHLRKVHSKDIRSMQDSIL